MLKYLGIITICGTLISICILFGMHEYKFRAGTREYTLHSQGNVLKASLLPPGKGDICAKCNLIIKNGDKILVEKEIKNETVLHLKIVDVAVEYKDNKRIIRVLTTHGQREQSFSHILFSFVFDNSWNYIEELKSEDIKYNNNELEIAVYLVSLFPIGFILFLKGRRKIKTSVVS